MRTPLIEFRDVTKRFDSQTVLDKINLAVYEEEITTLIGKSGTGKSVLLKHIIGLLKPDEGTILFRGKAIHEMKKKEWDEVRGRVSYMFQNNALFDSMTVFDNIALPLRQTTSLSRKEIEKKVMTRIEQTDLTDVARKYPSELSGGMQKRAALGRALVTDPEIVLFDEPTTGQDPIRKSAILSMIASYKKKFGFTAVLVSHDIPDVFFISNRILALHDRKIIFQGTPEELEDFKHPFLDEFIDSLEGLQEELTGLYSRRHFRIRYQTQLGRKHPDDRYAVAIFSLENLDEIAECLGHATAQEAIKSMGAYINKHFGSVGGFSARQNRNQFGTVLPFSELAEAEQILEDFSRELRARGLGEIEREVQRSRRVGVCFEFSVTAGLAEGRSSEEIGKVFQEAQARQQTIARFECETGGKG
jgi:phospholipid/cholesterol/gamma-HCH transport system ATP-binding protein